MTTATAQDEIGTILAILEPAGYVVSYGQPYAGLITGRFAAGPYSFEVIMKPDLSFVIAPGVAVAREYRAVLMNRAEDVLAEPDAAGWQLTAYPRMEFSG